MKSKLLSSVVKFAVDNKNTLLTIAEVAGVAACSYLWAKAGMKLKKAKDEDFDSLEKKDRVVETAKIVAVPAAASLATAGVCLFHNYINVKDIAALAALLKMSESKRGDLLEGIRMTAGDKKAEEAKTAESRVMAERIASDGKPWGYTGKGEYPCIDKTTQEKFNSSIESVKAAINEINARLATEEFVPVNDLRLELGLELLGKIGEDNGFPGIPLGGSLLSTDNGNLRFDSILVDGVGPVFVFEYDTKTSPWSDDKIPY